MKLSSRKTRHKKQITLEMTSMIDVVFLLLIFFIVTASFTQTERDLEAATTAKESTAQASETDLEPAIVEIVPGGGGFVYKIGSNELATADELEAILRRFPNRNDGAFVRAHDSAPYFMAAAAIQAAKSAGFPVVTYDPPSS
ncbi:MAG: biopolymer transporter ExbD [Pirellulaceae bacterium]